MIRLQRIGKKGQAYFRLIVTEHTTRPKGEYLELLGSYDPHKNTLEAKVDRVKHWMSKGAKLSPTANNLLVGKKMIEGEKVQSWKAKKKEATEASAEATPAPAVTPKPAPKSESEPQAEVPKEEPVTAPETKEESAEATPTE